MEQRIDRGLKVKMGAGEGNKMFAHAQASSAIIPVEDVAVLFRCGQCQETPLRPPVHACRTGHLTCSSCYDSSADSIVKCNKCRGPLEYRNFVLEEVLRNLTVQTCNALQDCGSSVHQSSSEQSLQVLLKDPDLLRQLEDARKEADRALKKKEEQDHLLWNDYPPNMPLARASHRPVQCPYPCGRIVTCSSIYPHFEMQHRHVAMTKIFPDNTALVQVQFMDVFATEVGCQALFVVHLDFDRDQDSDYSAVDMLKITTSSQEMLRKKILISTLTVGHLKFPAENDSLFLTVWGTTLYDVCPLTYTIRVSNDFSSHSTSFTGPLVSLHGSQSPQDVCERGECLLLSPGLLRKLQFSIDNPLRLAVTFHYDLQLESDRVPN